ncbi:MAG: hypothetical protein ACLPY1_14040 [Terracidiphilus sp.]
MRRRVVLTYIAMTMLAGVCVAQTGGSGDASAAPVVGVWRAQMDGLPAITLTVTDEGGSLTGAVLFYLHRREPGQPVTATPGIPEPLFHLQFDGKTLTFQVSHRRAHPPGSLQDGPVTFRLMVDGAGNAALVNESEPDPKAPAFVLVKSAY